MGEGTSRIRQSGEMNDVRASGMASSSGSGSNDPDAIASGIEQTRTEMTATIDAIQERLTPERVAGQATEVVDQARETATEVVEQARETATEVVEQARETAVEVTQQARDVALEVIDHAVEEAKAAVQELGTQARAAVRDATIGKVERVASRTGEAAGGIRSTVTTSIQQNPIPAALVGLGLGWMFLNRPSTSNTQSTDYRSYAYRQGEASRPASYYSSQAGSSYQGGYSSQAGGGSSSGGNVGQAAGQVGDMAGQVAGQVQQTAGQVVGQAQESVGQMVGQVQQTASQARGRLDQMLHENPMQVGALSLLIGGALALTMPPTSREQELMGPMRDQLVEKVQVTAQDTLNKVEKVAEEVQHTAEREAKAEGLTPS